MRRKELPKYYNKEKDLIICQLCFKEFRTIQTHITRVHKMDCVEYKKKFKLFNGDLMCLRTRKKMRINQKNLSNILEINYQIILKWVQPAGR